MKQFPRTEVAGVSLPRLLIGTNWLLGWSHTGAAAALDPVAEAEIYSKFDQIAGDKTAIYISHRLSSCKFCDEIAVFHEGAVIQQGTHAELVADVTGKYYELWHAQAQYYTE